MGKAAIVVVPLAIGAAISAAIAAATPRGLGIVEVALNTAIADIKIEIDNLQANEFGVNGYITAPAFGASARSSEMALHHTRAHAVTEQTLGAVLTDLVRFRDACIAAREDITGVDLTVATDLTRVTEVVDILGVPTTGSQDAHDQAVQDAGDVAPSDQNPYAEGA